MTHRNRNKNERNAAKAYAAAHGTSYQAALQHLRSRAAANPGIAGDPQTIANFESSVDDTASRDLEHVVRDAVYGIKVNDFSPFDYVEADIEEATLGDFVPQEVEVEEVELASGPGESPRYGVHLRCEGDGTVDWFVGHATPGDVEVFGDVVEGAEDGPGFFQQHEGAVPMRLSVYAEWTPDKTQWAEVSVDYAAMPDEELEARVRRHSDEEFNRLQRLGFLPDEDAIEAMVSEHEQGRKQEAP